MTGKKILIAYFSRTGNSRKIAKYIQKSIGGNLVQIKTKIPYPSDYDRCVSQAEKELEDDIRPEITTRVKKFATVFFDFGQSAWSVFAEYIAMMGFWIFFGFGIARGKGGKK